MYTKKSLWGVVLSFILVSSAPAQLPPGPPGAPTPPSAPAPGLGNYPAEMSIVQPEVEVRSGPARQYYPTSKLRQGERVLVLRQSKDQAGWLAIKPPPGSFSWIKGKYVKQIDAHNGYVQVDNNATAPVMPGSSLVPQAPNVESVQVPSGSLVVILDPPFNHEGETWLPIQPPPTEVRYIPAEAVNTPPIARAVTPAGAFPTAVGATDGNVISQADQAYRNGNIETARQLYRKAADSSTDPTQRAYALNRLATMQQPGNGPNWQPNYPTQNGQLTNQSTSRYSGVQPNGAPMTLTQPPQWSGWGYLRRASFDKDGQPAYVLESRSGQPMLYVVSEPGTTLKDYTSKFICLYGPITYRSEDAPRVQFMVATRVALP